MLAPGIVLFAVFMAAPILLHARALLPEGGLKGLGLGLGRAVAQVFAGLENYTATPHRPRVPRERRPGARATGSSSCRPCSAWRCCSRCCSTPAAPAPSGFSRVSIFLPYAVPAVIASLLWGFLYLPAVSPFYWIFEQLGCGRRALAALAGLVVFAIANIAALGRRRLQHDRDVHLAEGRADRDLRGGPHRRRHPSCRSRCASRSRSSRPRSIMTSLFSIIATLQVFSRADDPAAADQLPSRPPGSPLMNVYRDAFVRDDIYSAAATSVVIAARHARPVLRLPARRAAPRIRPGGLAMTSPPTRSRRARAVDGIRHRRRRRPRRRTASPWSRRSCCCSARSTACCRWPGW